MLPINDPSDLDRWVRKVKDGVLDEHLLIIGPGGKGKTEAVKRHYPLSDEEIAEIEDRALALTSKLELLQLCEQQLMALGYAPETEAPDTDEESGEVGGEGVSVGELQEQVTRLRSEIAEIEQWISGHPYTMYQGVMTPKALYEWLYIHREIPLLILNDVSVKGGMATLLKQVLEKLGRRIVRWGISREALRKGFAPPHFKLRSQIVVVANQFAPQDDADWDAIQSRTLIIRYNPSVERLVAFVKSWQPREDWEPDEQILAEIDRALQAGEIADLDLRKVRQAWKVKRAGGRREEWMGFLESAFKPLEIEHIPDDCAAILQWCARQDKDKFSKGEVYRKTGRFRGQSIKEEGKRRLDLAVRWLLDNDFLRKLEPLTNTGGRPIHDLYQVVKWTGLNEAKARASARGGEPQGGAVESPEPRHPPAADQGKKNRSAAKEAEGPKPKKIVFRMPNRDGRKDSHPEE